MQNITIKAMKTYFKGIKIKSKHNLPAFKKAINTLNEELKTDAFCLFLFIVEDKPINSLYTHSYEFHTGNGRYILETFTTHYNNFNK